MKLGSIFVDYIMVFVDIVRELYVVCKEKSVGFFDVFVLGG